ncbi:MAG: RdgB/HAM1 family non-canonical purine NTP pyrophosphatase [Patescibacteria group bacterium]|jgi:XTP/dITP diphosphohydrolase
MKKLLIATRSKGKFPEIVAGLAGIPFEFLNLNDIPELPQAYEVEESGSTFEGNALIKAMTLGRKTGILTLADDAGLCVDALGGRPGVWSARYAPGTDADRYNKLLEELKNVPEEKRTAKFITVIALYDPQTDKVRTCEGIYEGKIAFGPSGEHGFGYDPVFYNTTLKKTNAQMTLEEKNSVSHRGKALQKARVILEKEFI